MGIDRVLDRLEAAERDFVGRELLAPVVGHGQVMVRIAGVLCRLKSISGLPPAFQGWAILRTVSTTQAQFVGEAGLAQIEAYLELFPLARLILVRRQGPRWLAAPAQAGDRRLRVEGRVSLELAEEGLERFETVLARFDGQRFWFQRRDPSRDPAVAAYLRERLAAAEEGPLHKRGLTREEREVFAQLRQERIEAARDREESRLSEALDHAGARYRAHSERGGLYVVRYEIDGHQHVSTVNRDDLSVVSAGICLSGTDRRFDLTSLVGVLRQAHETGRIYWVGPDDEAAP